MKNIIVTSANCAICWATVQQILVQGDHVIMACANTDRAKQRLQQLPAQQRANAEVIPLEITDEDSIEAFLGTIKAKGVLIDGLVVADRTIESKYHSKHGYELTYLNNFIGQCITERC